MFKKLLPKSDFGKNVITLMTGTILAQVISLALSPVLSRLYSPEEFGLFSLFSNIAGTLAVVATLRYELAVMLPEKEEEAFNLLVLSVLISAIISVFIILLTWIFSTGLLQLIHAEEIGIFVWFIPVYVFFIGLNATLNYWLSRKKKYTLLSIGKVAQSGGTALASAGLTFTRFSHGGLLSGAVIGQVLGGITYSIASWKDLLLYKKDISLEKMKGLFRKYIHFATFNTPHAFLGNLQDLIVTGLLLGYFGGMAAGFYFFSYRILKMPVGIIGSSTYQVFYQKCSSLFPDVKAIQKLIRSVYIKMILIGVPGFGFIVLFGPRLFSFVFGQEWFDAGVVSQWMAPNLLLNFILTPVSAITVVMNKQPMAIFFGVADIILRTASILIGAYYHDFYLGIALMSISTSVMLVYGAWWYYHLPLSKKIKRY